MIMTTDAAEMGHSDFFHQMKGIGIGLSLHFKNHTS
jgi:hypothetical protein